MLSPSVIGRQDGKLKKQKADLNKFGGIFLLQ